LENVAYFQELKSSNKRKRVNNYKNVKLLHITILMLQILCILFCSF